MKKFSHALILATTTLFFCAPSLFAHHEEHGSLELNCGTNSFVASYRIRSQHGLRASTKAAILLAGSPATDYLSDDNHQYGLLVHELISSGYKVLELKYPRANRSYETDVDGFYAACYRQGFTNIKSHVKDLYDALIVKLDHRRENPEHRLVGLGYSLGAVQLQIMSLFWNLPFNDLVLTGVLMGDMVTGCLTGIEHQRRKRLGLDICSEPNIERGMSFGSFMHLVQPLTSSGAGCCIENGNGFGGCHDGVKNEYTADLNIDQQPYVTSSNIAIFEGGKTCDPSNRSFYGGNPGQAYVIADARKALGKDTTVHIYPSCGHSLLRCAGEDARHKMLRVLAP